MRLGTPPGAARTGLTLSTSPVPAGHRVAPMSFGPPRRRSEQDAAHDGYCRAYSTTLAACRQAPPVDGQPTYEQTLMARSLVTIALGNRRRRLVNGRLYTRDRTGAVHVGAYAPKARRLAPYLIKSFGLLSA